MAVSVYGRYTLRGFLEGQRGAVACIAAHPLGTYVACGGGLFSHLKICQSNKFSTGEEGTKIWHLPTANLIKSPAGATDRGITTAIVWLTRPDDTEDGLAYGTEDGYLCIWRRNRNENEVNQCMGSNSAMKLTY